jgi:hypothetical protein
MPCSTLVTMDLQVSNIRLHAIVFDKGAPTKATELGYLRKLNSMGDASIASGWDCWAWMEGIPAEFQDAANVMKYSTMTLQRRSKSRGLSSPVPEAPCL